MSNLMSYSFGATDDVKHRRKIEQYRKEKITEERIIKNGIKQLIIYDFDIDPVGYMAARKRLQNRVSSQVSRVIKQNEQRDRNQKFIDM